MTVRTGPLSPETAATLPTAWLCEDLVAGVRDARSLAVIRAELTYRETRSR